MWLRIGMFMENQRLPARLPRKRWLILASGVLLVIGAILITVGARLSSLTREWVIRALKERYQSDARLGQFNISFFPVIRATGRDLVVRYKSRTDVPPLISIQRFSAETGLLGLLRSPARVRKVRLEGLQIHVSPRRDEDATGPKPRREATRPKLPFLIGEIVADGTRLEILPKEAGKEPLTFDIYQLTLHSVGVGRPMSFRAALTNPKPPGLIHSTGEFGPWREDEPSLTPVSGRYTFQDADLSVFRGIAGILSSQGTYKGALGRIEVQGTTDTPDFTVEVGGHPVHLKTQFSAIVDGTNGNTLLQPVNAQFLRSSLVARGGVLGTPNVKGKTVSLDVKVAEARLEDLLRLAVKSDKPPMTGAIHFNTKFELPPGERDIIDKLYLKGEFGIASAQFTDPNVQQKIETLSRRGKGEPKNETLENVVSNLRGRFVLKNGVIRFSNLSFDVPGASLRLDGDYELRSEKLDFRGTLQLQAKISQTTTGVKSFLLKAIDPLFHRKKAGAILPIKITGTRQEPSFGLDIRRTFSRK